MRQGVRHRWLTGWAKLVSHRPGWVLGVTGLLTLAAIAITATSLRFNPNRNDLISPSLEWNQRFIAWQKHFPGSNDLIVVVDSMEGVDGGAGDHAQARALVDELGRQLSQQPEIERVVWGFDASAFSPRAAKLLPMEEFTAQLQQVGQSKPLLENANLAGLIRDSVGQATKRMMSPDGTPSSEGEDQQAFQAVEQIDQMHQLFKAMRGVMSAAPDQPVDFEAMLTEQTPESAWQYMTSANGRLYFIRITPRLDPSLLSAFAPAITSIRGVMAQVLPRHPNVQAGLTGIDVVESDETAAASWDSTWTSIAAAALILILLVTAFHSWRMPLLAMTALGVAIAWSFGFLTLTIGHLQVLSVVFALILLGLGIDYAILLSSTYERLRHDYPDTLEGFTHALSASMGQAGPGMLTGAITTACAFATTLFTNFTGVAEMGLAAGAGILLCLLSMFTVFAALLRLFKHAHRHLVPMEDRRFHFFKESWVLPFVNHPRATLVTGVFLLALSLAAMTTMRFDFDLLKLQPRGVDSVQWQQRIVDRGGEPIWFAVSVVDDLDHARALAQAYRRQSTVSPRLGGVGMLFPPQEQRMNELLASTRQELGQALDGALAEPAQATSADGQALALQLAAMRQVMMLVQAQSMPATIRQALVDFTRTLDAIATQAAGLSAEELHARLARVEQAYRTFRHDLAHKLRVLLDGQPLTLDDLPAELMRSYISDQGKLALEVFPSLPAGDRRIDGPLSPHFLPGFTRQLVEVDPHVTGVVMQIYRSGHLIKTAYQRAGVAALLLVFVLVWLDFRSVWDALLALVPVTMGFGVTFGVMWLAGVQVNPANIIVLPLMFGIGVDAGVHALHRWHAQPMGQPPGLTGGTGKAITLTSFTTMIGFGMMMLASHRGIASLGFVLTTGIGLTLLSCWTMLAACLELRRRRLVARQMAGQAG